MSIDFVSSAFISSAILFNLVLTSSPEFPSGSISLRLILSSSSIMSSILTLISAKLVTASSLATSSIPISIALRRLLPASTSSSYLEATLSISAISSPNASTSSFSSTDISSSTTASMSSARSSSSPESSCVSTSSAANILLSLTKSFAVCSLSVWNSMRSFPSSSPITWYLPDGSATYLILVTLEVTDFLALDLLDDWTLLASKILTRLECNAWRIT